MKDELTNKEEERKARKERLERYGVKSGTGYTGPGPDAIIEWRPLEESNRSSSSNMSSSEKEQKLKELRERLAKTGGRLVEKAPPSPETIYEWRPLNPPSRQPSPTNSNTSSDD